MRFGAGLLVPLEAAAPRVRVHGYYCQKAVYALAKEERLVATQKYLLLSGVFGGQFLHFLICTD